MITDVRDSPVVPAATHANAPDAPARRHACAAPVCLQPLIHMPNAVPSDAAVAASAGGGVPVSSARYLVSE